MCPIIAAGPVIDRSHNVSQIARPRKTTTSGNGTPPIFGIQNVLETVISDREISGIWVGWVISSHFG